MNLHFLTDTIVLLGAAVIVVPLFQWLKLGTIPGFLTAGFLLGPSVLGYFHQLQDIQHLAELGVVLLLFVIGIELRPSHFWKMRHHVFGLGSAQVILTTVVVALVVNGLLGVKLDVAILIAAALALSSTAFVLQLLSEQKALNTQHGRPAIAILLLQDLAVVPLLLYVSMLSQETSRSPMAVALVIAESAGILLLVILAARYVLNPLLTLLARFASTDIFTATALLLVLGFASMFQNLGLSMAMGAFVAGLLIADSSFRHQISAEIEPFRSLLLGLFFMTMGMSLNLATLLAHPLAIFLSLLALLLVKFLILFGLAKAFRLSTPPATALAFILAQSGEFALVLFAVAYTAGILDDSLYRPLLIVVLLSMLVTPLLNLLAQKALSRSKTLSKIPQTDAPPEPPGEDDPDAAPILIAGFGRMGRRIAELLEHLNIPYVGLDNNVDLVNEARALGHTVYYGEAQKPEVLRAAGGARAPVAIVAIDNLEGAAHVVSSLRQLYPQLPIFARGHNRARCRELLDLGATSAISETFEASSEIAREALLLIGLEEEAIDSTLVAFKRDYYAVIEGK